jgi:hypothetical protein
LRARVISQAIVVNVVKNIAQNLSVTVFAKSFLRLYFSFELNKSVNKIELFTQTQITQNIHN